jgi:hypothetical protein
VPELSSVSALSTFSSFSAFFVLLIVFRLLSRALGLGGCSTTGGFCSLVVLLLILGEDFLGDPFHRSLFLGTVLPDRSSSAISLGNFGTNRSRLLVLFLGESEDLKGRSNRLPQRVPINGCLLLWPLYDK